MVVDFMCVCVCVNAFVCFSGPAFTNECICDELDITIRQLCKDHVLCFPLFSTSLEIGLLCTTNISYITFLHPSCGGMW